MLRNIKCENISSNLFIFCTYVSWIPGLLWRWVFLCIKENNSYNYIFNTNNQVDKNIFTCFRLSSCSENSNVRIKDQHGSFSVHIGKGVFGCFADLEMMFVMYQKATSWK
jgi:hypothetical protein